MAEPGDYWARLRREMVRRQLQARGIRDARVLGAMETVPREEFVPAEFREAAYQDSPLPLGYGQTVSQPYMVALMLELLAAGPEDKVLEVGAGSGYQAALLGKLAREVWGVEIVPELAERAAQTVERLGYTNVHVVAGDGTLGYAEQAPYDRIVVAAAAPRVPEPLTEQLAEEGRIVAPVGARYSQRCVVQEKGPEGMREQESIGCVFVPLIGEHGWQEVPEEWEE